MRKRDLIINFDDYRLRNIIPDDGVIFAPPRPFFEFKYKKTMLKAIGFRKEHWCMLVSGDLLNQSEERDATAQMNTRTSYISQVLQTGISFTESDAKDYFLKLLSRRPGVDKMHSEEDVHKRLQGLDAVVAYAHKHRTLALQSELTGKSTNTDDIWAHIGEDGRLIKCWGGSHRLSIAQMMNLEAIPVRIGLIHEAAVKSGKLDIILRRSKTLQSYLSQYQQFNEKIYNRFAVAR